MHTPGLVNFVHLEHAKHKYAKGTLYNPIGCYIVTFLTNG